MTTFGYATGDGSGAAVFGWPFQYATRYINTTGSTVYVDQVDILNVGVAIATTTAQVAIYTDLVDHPEWQRGLSSVATSLSVGTNTFSFSTPISVGPGVSVWVAFRCADNVSISGSVATGRLNYSLTDGNLAFDDPFQVAVAYYNLILPAVLRGSTTGPGTLTNLRIPAIGSEPLAAGAPSVRLSAVISEPLADAIRNLRIAAMLTEVLLPIPKEEIMVTAILPGFGNSLADPSIPEAANPATGATPGLAFSVHMRPRFNTRVSTSVNFKSIRTPLAPNPSWEFELPYEFLSDRDQANSSLRNILGFFCARMGSADPFLVKVPEFYLSTDATIGDADGSRLQWDLTRWIGTEFSEPIGQVDLANTISVFSSPSETVSVPGSGPYTVTVAHAAAFVADVGVTIGGTPLTKVASAPAAMQYSVAAGVYTFNSAQHGASAVITYRYLIDPSAYTITLPNKIVFGAAPAAARLSWTGQYFFTCYFNEDMADFEKFYDKLWALQQLTFHSELLA